MQTKEVLASSLTLEGSNHLHGVVTADQVRKLVTSQQWIEIRLKNRIRPDQYHFLSPRQYSSLGG